MKTKRALVRIGTGFVVALVACAAIVPHYVRYSWECTRQDIATFADAAVSDGEISVTVHVPKLSNAELDALKTTFADISKSYYRKRLAPLWVLLSGDSRVRGDRYACHLNILGVDWSWEDAAAGFRYTLSCPPKNWSELESRAAEIEEIFVVATARMEGARVVVKKGKEPNQALQTTPVTRSEI